MVQLDASADVAQGRVTGRVEHVLSGRATRFWTVEGCVGFMQQVLADKRQARGHDRLDRRQIARPVNENLGHAGDAARGEHDRRTNDVTGGPMTVQW